MAIKRTLLDIRMTDGTEHESIPVTVADQIKLSRTSRTHKWDLDNAAGQMLASIFLGWHALVRLGLYSGTWEQFEHDAEVVTDHAEADEVDPTRPDQPNG